MTRVDPGGGQEGSAVGTRLRTLLIPLGLVVITVGIGLVRVAWNPVFYFADDTQLGAAGIWYELGDNLLNGTIRDFNPQAWQAGNYWAEGQWGLLNPVIWLIGVGVRLATDIAVAATTVKLVFLSVMAGGGYLLGRSFGASRVWAFIAAVLLPQAGFTAYMDAPSWVTGLITTALFPWAWWALRRLENTRSPIPFLVISYLLVTVGYVFGTMLLALILLVSLVSRLWRREWPSAGLVTGASFWAGLWAVVVYLPGVLTAPVTERGNTEIINALFLNADLSDLAASTVPVAASTIGAWWGPVTAGPLIYIAWALPVVLLVRPWMRVMWRGTGALVVVAIVMVVLIIGPSDIGPIRWPVRFMPYLALVVLVLFAVLMTRGFPHRVTRIGTISAVVTSVACGWLSWAQTPAITRSVTIVVLVQLGVIGCAAFIARRAVRTGGGHNGNGELRRGMAVTLVLMVAGTAAFATYQLRAFSATPLPTFAVPTGTSELSDVMTDAEGDVMTVGDALTSAFDADTFTESLVANLWYFSPAAVSNLYTVLPFSAYSNDLCVDLRGSTCAAALDTLLEQDRTTGLPVADLLAVSEIVGYRDTFPSPPETLPDGWQLISVGSATWRLGRETPVSSAGGIVWEGDGTQTTVLSQTDSAVTFRVDSVGPDARVVLSRLAWPGYRVSGAVPGEPVRGYLLTINVADASPGATVTVSFAPPGQPIMIAAALCASLLGAAWLGVRLRRQFRFRDIDRRESEPAERP